MTRENGERSQHIARVCDCEQFTISDQRDLAVCHITNDRRVSIVKPETTRFHPLPIYGGEGFYLSGILKR